MIEFFDRAKQPLNPAPVGWRERTASLEECGEPLVPASLFPSKILVRSWYFGEGIPGSLPEAWLREGVFERLKRAARQLPDGWHFVIWDGWRPFSLQKRLFDILLGRVKAAEPGLSEEEARKRARVFVAIPSTAPETVSGHLTGGAVDLTIADAEGRYLDMGGGFDEAAEHSHTNYYEGRGPSPARDNRRILVSLMEEAGFNNYPHEWWHFDYGNRHWALRTNTPGAIYGYIKPPFQWQESVS